MEALNKFFNAIAEFFGKIFDWLNEAYESIINFFKELPEWIFSEFADGVVEFFNAIPVPDFFKDAGSAFSNISGDIAYFAEPFAIGFGVTVILAAYLLRFILRRIPFIG
ncbi:hypothetical protein VQ643_01145 [Pseudomonas sp. F1_0610]|uniref:hypothetical protein n=1 Tax=Pseudomonas sp. F1_0610 TaxID=3114284 RepID=UPI0039C33968